MGWLVQAAGAGSHARRIECAVAAIVLVATLGGCLGGGGSDPEADAEVQTLELLPGGWTTINLRAESAQSIHFGVGTSDDTSVVVARAWIGQSGVERAGVEHSAGISFSATGNPPHEWWVVFADDGNLTAPMPLVFRVDGSVVAAVDGLTWTSAQGRGHVWSQAVGGVAVAHANVTDSRDGMPSGLHGPGRVDIALDAGPHLPGVSFVEVESSGRTNIEGLMSLRHETVEGTREAEVEINPVELQGIVSVEHGLAFRVLASLTMDAPHAETPIDVRALWVPMAADDVRFLDQPFLLVKGATP